MSLDLPYSGLRVVDLSQGVAGPYCAMLLARHGADVVKVEPLEGDWTRSLGPRYGDHTAYSIPGNTGKRGIAVDLKTPEGRAIIDRMLPTADVFVEGFRPGVIDRLGFAYDRLKVVNPGLVYLSISGFGQEGPLSRKPAMDPILQAFTGFMSENHGTDGIPHRTPTVVIDMSTALYAHQAVAAALYAKARGQGGRRVNASLMEAAANLQSIRLMGAYQDGPFKPASAPSGTYRAKDGRWLQVGAVKHHEFTGLMTALGFPEIAADPRFDTNSKRVAEAAYLVETVKARLLTKPAAEWRDILTEAGLQNEVLQSYAEFVDHPHTVATGLITKAPQPGSDATWAVPNPPGTAKAAAGTRASQAPSHGQHTSEVLAEFGYSAAEIASLFEKRIVAGR